MDSGIYSNVYSLLACIYYNSLLSMVICNMSHIVLPLVIGDICYIVLSLVIGDSTSIYLPCIYLSLINIVDYLGWSLSCCSHFLLDTLENASDLLGICSRLMKHTPNRFLHSLSELPYLLSHGVSLSSLGCYYSFYCFRCIVGWQPCYVAG
jgi:hypothetical protein